MKQYLWAGVMVLLIQSQASENPFDLKENFGKLDIEQDSMIAELRKTSDKQIAKKETIVAPVKVIEVKKAPPVVQVELLEALINEKTLSAKEIKIKADKEAQAIAKALTQKKMPKKWLRKGLQKKKQTK